MSVTDDDRTRFLIEKPLTRSPETQINKVIEIQKEITANSSIVSEINKKRKETEKHTSKIM